MCTCYVTRRREPTRLQIPRDLGRAQPRPDATTRDQGVRARTSADPNLNFTHLPKAAPVRTLQVQSRQRAHGSGARLGLSAACSGQPHTNRHAAPFGLLFFACLFAVRHCKATARSSVGPPVLLAPAHPFSKPFTRFACFTLSPTRLTLRDALLSPPSPGPASALARPARQLRPARAASLGHVPGPHVSRLLHVDQLAAPAWLVSCPRCTSP